MEERERVLEKILPNGDVYVGIFEGKYKWANQTIFDGEWNRSRLSGKGKIIWASGSKYEGEFSGGFLNGYGTLYGFDGSFYEGSWRMNVQHGFGKKIFSNSDIFEGSWREGMPDGFGKYLWSNGNFYFGNWKCGKMWGRGILKWENGDLFDGFWSDGMKHRTGCHRFSDGSYFFGTWSGGLKDGHGIFYPSGSRDPFLESWYSCLTLSLLKEDLKNSFRERKFMTGGGISHKWPMRHDWWSSGLKYRERISNRNHVDSHGQSQVNGRRFPSSVEDYLPFYEQEYAQGMLIMQRVRLNKYGLLDGINKLKMFGSKDERHPCKTIIMGDKSYHLMLSLQLGIRYTVGKITPVPMRGVRSSDFGPRARIQMYFPQRGSQFTPSHCSADFFWEDYCPMVFRNLREMFRLDAADYMMSISAGDSLKELLSPGKSGSIFYLSQDERFVIKTLRQSELKVLLKMLPAYYNHVSAHENTLITKFFGLHQITLNSRRRVRFVVMGNMFRTELRIHRRYDLKGSSHGRSTDRHKIDGNTTLKDLDLPYIFYLDKSWHESLFKQIFLDCMFLQSQHIIDYSLLLGIHFRAPENLNSLNKLQDLAQNCNPSFTSDSSLPQKSLLLVTHEPNSSSSTHGLHVRGSTLRASPIGNEEVDLLLPDAGRLRVQLGVNMPARVDRKPQSVDHPESTVDLYLSVYDVIIYFGIIDILQDFNTKKKLEHGLKSLRFDPMTISSVEPNLYAKRFIGFLGRVFQENEESFVASST